VKTAERTFWTVLSLCLLVSLTSSQSFAQQVTDPVTPIKHIIIIMQENHSFDNYFGTYPTANGTLSNNALAAQLEGVSGIPNGVCLPASNGCLAPHLANSSIVPDPKEGQLVYENDVNNGSMNGFAAFSGPQAMSYFDYHQIPAYWDYAEEYGLGNHYFASVLSTTLPNRLMAIEGDSQFVSTDLSSPTFFSDLYKTLIRSATSTIFYQLAASGISWGYFDYFTKLPVNASTPFDLAASIRNISYFFSDLSTGTNLPSVSFVTSLEAKGLDELSPDSVTTGEQWAVSVVNAVEQSSYWSSSAIFITWDEGGGFYDHVPPPRVLSIDHDFAHPLLGYGQRVPLLVISPYAKEDYVSQTILNHMSLIKFIEYDFDLPTLNSNVANSHNLLDFFDFTQAPRAPIVLGSSGNYSSTVYPVPLQIPLDQLSYSRTGSYTGTESTQQVSAGSLLGSFVGIFTGTAGLVQNVATGKFAQITIFQIYSFAYFVIFIGVIVIALWIARIFWKHRRRVRAEIKRPPSPNPLTSQHSTDTSFS
jgi:phospholipase C